MLEVAIIQYTAIYVPWHFSTFFPWDIAAGHACMYAVHLTSAQESIQ